MASLTPFLGPNSGGKPWVEQISKTLKDQLAVKIDTPPISIYEVPKSLKDEKPDAYVPQRIGLGPNHRFQAEDYQKMEQNKLTAVKRVLKSSPGEYQDSEDQIVEKVKEMVPVISACYEKLVDADADTLAWSFFLDGLFLLDQLGAFSDEKLSIDAKDLIMLENQIPLVVLMEIQKVLSPENDYADEELLQSKFQTFSQYYSPFVLSEGKVDFKRVNHLLGYMYHSIVNNDTRIPREVSFINPGTLPPEKSGAEELLEAAIQLGNLIPGAKPFLVIIESLQKNFSEVLGTKQVVEEINVPSVSQLRDAVGVKFQRSPRNGGIRNISLVQTEDDERIVHLPIMTLNFDSEVVLRNLMAYETLMAKNSIVGGFGLEITEYMDFLCGIIDDAKDVSLLREEKIIEGTMRDEEIVDLFNGIGRSLGNMNGQSELRRIVDELNKVYETNPSVWVQKVAEKQARASAKAITFLVSISGTLFLIRETLSQAYGSNPPEFLVQLTQKFGLFSSLIQ